MLLKEQVFSRLFRHAKQNVVEEESKEDTIIKPNQPTFMFAPMKSTFRVISKLGEGAMKRGK